MRIRKSRQQTEGNQTKYPMFRMSQFIESTEHLEKIPKLPLADRRNRLIDHPSKATIKISTKRTMGQSTRLLRDRSTAMLKMSRLAKMQSSDFASLSAIEIRKHLGRFEQSGGIQLLRKAFNLSQAMNEQAYSYKVIEQKMQKLHETVKILASNTLVYRTFAFSAFCFFQYGSYSLALYYFDRAFKAFYDRDHSFYLFEKHLQLQLYKSVSRIFLVKARYAEAKNFAFKMLRKSWLIPDADEQIAAYDLLGKIYMETQQIAMSRYFHYRMASGERESNEIMAMSRQEMSKESREKMEFVCYETINIFVDKDGPFNDILQNHYYMRSLEHAKQSGLNIQSQQIYIYTHHSPNRQLNNYHLLQRKMIEARQSKEIHFIRPKDCHRIRKLFSEYSSILHEILHKFEGSVFATERLQQTDSS